MDYTLYFLPERDPQDSRVDAVLVPVLISDDGEHRVILRKVVTTIEKALSFRTGFELHSFVEEAGGIEEVVRIATREEKTDDAGTSEAQD